MPLLTLLLSSMGWIPQNTTGRLKESWRPKELRRRKSSSQWIMSLLIFEAFSRETIVTHQIRSSPRFDTVV